MNDTKRKRGRPKGSTNRPKETLPVSNLSRDAPTSANPKPSTAAQQREHKYTLLNDISAAEKESTYNFYAIVIDATRPHKKGEKLRRQIMRVIDTSCFPGAFPQDAKKPGCVSVTFFSYRSENMPECVRVGDIIRVHRASCGTFKGYKTLSCNLGYAGSWCQF